MYYAGRVDEALPLYERLYVSGPEARLTFGASSRGPLFEDIPVIRIMRVAHARKIAGDESGALDAAKLARQGHNRLLAAGRSNHNRDLAHAMISAFDGEPEGMIAALRSAVRHGWRDADVFDEVVFEEWAGDLRFVAVKDEMDAILAAEREEVLQLICLNNPVPDDWQPLPETCDGVTKQLP